MLFSQSLLPQEMTPSRITLHTDRIDTTQAIEELSLGFQLVASVVWTMEWRACEDKTPFESMNVRATHLVYAYS
jgi:hypothetical protein